jgi:putative ABC transport system permease protein
MPQADYEALISIEVAELNDLYIGDTIRLYSNLIADDIYRTISRELTIVGIYFDMTENPFAGFLTSPFVNRRNEILTSFNTVMAYIGEDDLGFTVDAVFYLHNPSYLAAFEAEARSLGLDDMLLVSTNEAEYIAIVAPVEGLRRVAQTFMWVVLILGGTILIILSTLAIRERKYEIGVLRAMGMKKHKVAAGLWAEMLALAVISLAVGLTVGAIVAQPVSDTLLAAQVENVSLQNGTTGVGGTSVGGMPVVDLGSGSANYSALDTFDIFLEFGTILQIIGISLFLTSLAALAAITRITKYEPIKI